MAKARRHAQIGLIAAIVVMAACLGVLLFQSDGAKAKVPATSNVTSSAVGSDATP